MARRKGMMVGKGKKGYHNVVPKDKIVHSQSAKGRKQPQRIPQIAKGINEKAIKIKEIMTLPDKDKAFNSEVIGFSKSTVNFDSLGYNPVVVTEVKLKNFDYPLSIEVKGNKSTRELNKFKGKKLRDVV